MIPTGDYQCYATSTLPVGQGVLARLSVFRETETKDEIVTLSHGPLELPSTPLVRLHSACLTGDVLGSLKCDCGPQLRSALDQVMAAVSGILLYLPSHEGRGIGLGDKVRSYGLQDGGLDTVAANRALGFLPDLRDYRGAAAVLRLLGVAQVRLLTNNPQKIAAMEAGGVQVTERIALVEGLNAFNVDYLRAKREMLGHILPEA